MADTLLLAFAAVCLGWATRRALHARPAQPVIRHVGADEEFTGLLEQWLQDDAWKTYGLDPEPSRLVVI